jgi:alginate O-acetyltransferase complex protein AlgI
MKTNRKNIETVA